MADIIVNLPSSVEIDSTTIVGATDGKVLTSEGGVLKEVDAVSLAVPTFLHRSIAEEVISSGIHILIEKPLAGTLSDAEYIAKLAEDKAITLCVGHIERYNPIVNYVSQRIKEGVWGKLVSMSSKRLSPLEIEALYLGQQRRIDDVGVLFDLSIHDIDIMLHFAASKAISVSAMGGNTSKISHEDHINILINFENGIVGLSEANWLTPIKERTLRLTFKKYNVKLDFAEQQILVSSFKEVKVEDSSSKTIGDWDRVNFLVDENKISLNMQEPLKCELNDFLESIMSNRSPMVSGLDGVKAIKIVEGCKTSMGTGKTIPIN